MNLNRNFTFGLGSLNPEKAAWDALIYPFNLSSIFNLTSV